MSSDTQRDIAISQSEILIEKAKKGDDKAQNKIVNLLFKRIYNFSLNFFGDHDLAMEVTQITFITVIRKLDQLQDIKRFKTWLYRIATNYCHEEQRKNLRFQQVGLEAIDNEFYSSYNADDPVSTTEVSRIIRRLLNRLPDEQKEVIILKELEGLKFREIAKVLGESENTIKTRCYYGLKALQDFLEKNNISKYSLYGNG